MPCTVVGSAIMCGPPRGVYKRIRRHCWTCDTETDQVQTWDGAWYGTTQYCTVCGDIWQDGERAERPFYRYWKRDRLAAAQRMLDHAIPEKLWERYADADVRMAVHSRKRDIDRAIVARDKAMAAIAEWRADEQKAS